MLLSDKYPFLTNYFETGIKNKLTGKGVPITHSLLFWGRDLESQYILAKEIARELNCTGDHTDKCQCLNCKWIREDSHPAVLTISRTDNTPADDETKTVISIKQSEMIKNMLVTSSEFFRVFIMTTLFWITKQDKFLRILKKIFKPLFTFCVAINFCLPNVIRLILHILV